MQRFYHPTRHGPHASKARRSDAATGISAEHVDANDWRCGSEPAVAAKPPVERAADGDDHADDEKIAVAPFELRHELEVHAVDAGDCGRDGEDGSPGREPSGDRRLLCLSTHQ